MPIDILMPALSPTMEEGALARWNIKVGDRVAPGDVIAEIETDKATMEVEAVDEGVVTSLLVAEGAQGVKVNAVIAVLLGADEPAMAAPPAAPSPAPPATAAATAPAPAEAGRTTASPLARRLARERGLDLALLKGSGPQGRIVRADVDRYVAPPAATAPATPQLAPAPPKTPKPAAAEDALRKLYAGRAFTEVTLDGMRKTIAARLTEAKQTIPHFYLRRDIDLDALLAFRADLNNRLSARGVKLSVNDFIIKASALALQQVPDCNAVWAGDRVLRFAASDVAVAVAVEGGLFTPILRDAEAKTLSAISAEMKSLAARARDRKLAPQDYQGGSFAISNLGMFGVDNFDAVINPPQASILAVGAGVRKPVVRGDRIEAATVMSVTLSVDHRVIDGALGAQFLSAFKALLEEPLAMLA